MTARAGWGLARLPGINRQLIGASESLLENPLASGDADVLTLQMQAAHRHSMVDGKLWPMKATLFHQSYLHLCKRTLNIIIATPDNLVKSKYPLKMMTPRESLDSGASVNVLGEHIVWGSLPVVERR